MKKILLIATGGTIACSDEGNGLTPRYNIDDLLERVPGIKDLCHITGKHIFNIDSSNMNPKFWIHIAKTIYDNYKDYDGFVITHGTDTMAYTSSALTYMLQNINKPVVITGAQFSIEEFGTDARQNLVDAIRFSLEDVSGVFVAFDGKIINGTRAMKVKTKSLDAFKSVNYPYVANVKYGKIYYNEDIHQKIKLKSDKELIFESSLCTDVLVIKLFPGIDPKIFDFIKKEYKGVIIESFGIGGIPFENFDITSKVKELTDAGVAVVVTTQCLEEGVDLNIYEVGKELAKTKIIYANDMNTEAIVAKLMWALGKSENIDEVKKLIETPVMGDCCY
ncbi:asparaginase [Oceanirhabdus sp. W0125-5]|uniref:asparaginase n=1 Tax=Oceanirhabdus sp. W0125-5 TaxID=2999116 RepID=UPI0022F3124E|nr:asparaginase [Oceanirhabdus sp. W0125-5]WBW97094.1 asparaginase [Oceanirhabdus sp. W0125-5]